MHLQSEDELLTESLVSQGPRIPGNDASSIHSEAPFHCCYKKGGRGVTPLALPGGGHTAISMQMPWVKANLATGKYR